MRQMGDLVVSFELDCPSRIERFAPVLCQVDAHSSRCESYLFIEKLGSAGRQRRHTRCEVDLPFPHEDSPQATITHFT
jgi:hypothetical protein